MSVDPTEKLTEAQLRRYARQISLSEIGVEGQRKLIDSKVLSIGTGGLGSPASLYLGAAGVGTLGIVDFDEVEESNLQRQIMHSTADVGRPKVESAVDALRALNPTIEVVAIDARFTRENAFEVLEPWDVVLDCTDNFPARYLANDATQILGKPLVHGSIYQFEGQATVFMPGKGTPCYRCLFPRPPKAGPPAGPFGMLPGIVGSIQAAEAIKLVVGIGEPLIGRLLIVDGLAMEFREVKIRWDRDCPACGEEPTVTELIDYEAFCGLPSRSP